MEKDFPELFLLKICSVFWPKVDDYFERVFLIRKPFLLLTFFDILSNFWNLRIYLRSPSLIFLDLV